MIEHRLFVRFPMSGLVIVQKPGNVTETVNCELMDLSYDGIGFYSPTRMEPGSTVRFVIVNRQLNVNLGGSGRTVFCNPDRYGDKDRFRVGIEFAEVDRDQVRAILVRARDLPPATP